MHVAQILRKYNPAEWGGTETAVKQMMDGLKSLEVRGTLFCPKLPDPPRRDPFTDAGHCVRRYRAFLPVLNLSGEQRAQLISVGGNLMSLDLPISLLRGPFSVIHTHALNRLGGVAFSVARLRHLPLVVSIHGGVLDLPEKVRQTLATPLQGGWEWGRVFGVLLRSRKVLEGADAIVTCNPREAALQREKFPGKRIVVQPHGVPVARFQEDCRTSAREAFPTLSNRQVLLVIGRIDPVKNQAWVLLQMPEILRRHPDAVLVLAGPCTDELYGKALRKEVRRLGLESKVLFTGGLPHGDPRLIGLMQNATSVIVPSLSETFGLVILEAWAAGTPVLSTRNSGALSLIRSGENGFLFDLEDENGFHHQLDELLASPARANRMGQRGGQLAAQEYDTLVLAGRMKRLYKELIREKGL